MCSRYWVVREVICDIAQTTDAENGWRSVLGTIRRSLRGRHLEGKLKPTSSMESWVEVTTLTKLAPSSFELISSSASSREMFSAAMISGETSSPSSSGAISGFSRDDEESE